MGGWVRERPRGRGDCWTDQVGLGSSSSRIRGPTPEGLTMSDGEDIYVWADQGRLVGWWGGVGGWGGED